MDTVPSDEPPEVPDRPPEVPDRPPDGAERPPPGYGQPRPPPSYGPQPGPGSWAPGYGSPAPPYGTPAPGYAGPPPYYPPPGYGGPPPSYPPPGYGWPGLPTDPQGRPLAEFSDRATGFLVDYFGVLLPVSLLVGLAVLFMVALAASGSDRWPTAAAAGTLTAVTILLTLPVIYRAELVYRRGQTVGQRVARVMVVDGRTGNRPSHGQAWARAACQTFISNAVFGLGYWWALWDPQRRTLHDIICNTVVIKVG
jgi:uncharacterized RDD family membrane protein YckC